MAYAEKNARPENALSSAAERSPARDPNSY